MPRRRSLTTAAIAAAALAVIDRDGTAGLSMRAVATELRVGTMSLYRYVSDREELERLVADLVLAPVDTSQAQHLPWQRRVIALRCVVAYITGALQAEYLGPLAGPGTTALAALSPAKYPLLAETAKYAREVSPEQEFGQGLDIVLQGLTATLASDNG